MYSPVELEYFANAGISKASTLLVADIEQSQVSIEF